LLNRIAMRSFSFIFASMLPLVCAAQQFSVGFVGGVPAQPPLGTSATKLPFVMGPILSFGSFAGLSLETGVLFHRLGATDQSYTFRSLDGAIVSGTDRWKARAIEIPLLLKYHFLNKSRTWRPFLSAGPTLRRTSIDRIGFRSTLSQNPSSTSTSEPMTASKTVKWNLDPAVGAGVSFRAGRVHIEPEVRYSYWGAGKHDVVRQNQVHFLFGLRF
jgi:hypothetical protein